MTSVCPPSSSERVSVSLRPREPACSTTSWAPFHWPWGAARTPGRARTGRVPGPRGFRISSTSPRRGYALITKLCVVLAVVALGAWNWRRQKPRLGSEAAVLALRGSARAELAVAAVVLAVTAVLVSL